MPTGSNEKSFDELGLNPLLINNIYSQDYKTPTPIQAESIPHIINKKDLLGQAQTGTGKTAAFVLPILHNLIDSEQNKKKGPKVLVLAPTRELALQVEKVVKDFTKGIQENLRSVAIYGGSEYNNQIRALNSGANIVVGTAGRVMDHMRKGTLNLDNLEAIVLDEADEMLRMGFIDDVKWILSFTKDSCQRLLFSATMPNDVLDIVSKYLRNPVKVKIKSQATTASTITQKFINVGYYDKANILDRVLSSEDTNGVLIFVKTKADTVSLTTKLQEMGYSSTAMNGDMSQKQREYIINQFKREKIKILIATDVVARGLDIESINHVINFDLPQDNEAYVHRIGRTGRAGREGDAISLVSPREMRQLRSIERITKQKIEEMQIPSAVDVTLKRKDLFKKKILEYIEKFDTEKYYEVVSELFDETVSTSSVVGAIVYAAQENSPLFIEEFKKPLFQTNRPRSSSYSNDRYDSRSSRSFGDPYTRNSGTHNRQREHMTQYRLATGRNDNIEIRNIVGAIAGETDIPGKEIGQVRIYDDYSTVMIPTRVAKIYLTGSTKIRVKNNIVDLYEN